MIMKALCMSQEVLAIACRCLGCEVWEFVKCVSQTSNAPSLIMTKKYVCLPLSPYFDTIFDRLIKKD